MKKILCIAVSLLLILALASCDIKKDDVDPLYTAPLYALNNGVIREVSLDRTDVPENTKYIGTKKATKKNNANLINAAVVYYYFEGDVVNWKTENDLVYVITENENSFAVIDTNDMAPVYSVKLDGAPAEINITGDKIYISFPKLHRIDIFTKADGTKESSLDFDHEVSSFCVDGNYIFYSEHDQHCEVFRKDLITNEPKRIVGVSFYYPKLYLNQEDRILYIGETRGSGCSLSYYNADSLNLMSIFEKNDYGITNKTRELFHVGDDVFWGSYRLSDTDASKVKGKYGTANYGCTVFADDGIVATFHGLFLTDTYECIIDYYQAFFEYEYILVTRSNNVFFRKKSEETDMIVGINYKLQKNSQRVFLISIRTNNANRFSKKLEG